MGDRSAVALAAAGVLVAAPALADTYQWSAGEYAGPDVNDGLFQKSGGTGTTTVAGGSACLYEQWRHPGTQWHDRA